ncbi:hypothetical protein GJU43_22595 [Flavobacterium sp. LC2016-23]|uniref:hypothetical protein n=1 Tax=Flavobacterium sp. LC2016-23 TaxID=2666330 RepID=UPI0012B14BA3|nr:hypothetical protein [Flavobacterium sp. LC2016-23]MRX42074.1 hypothetical protein [Flavobacterium sp. LC2016-23]
MKKIIKGLIDFWLDYASSSYNRLKKKDKDPEIDILLNTSFIQSLNINLILVVIFKLTQFKVKDFKYMIVTTILLFIFNYFWYNKLQDIRKEEIKNRTPRFSNSVYKVYAVFSAILLFFVAYVLK